MENDDALVGTILSRRDALALAAGGGMRWLLGAIPGFSAAGELQEKAMRDVKLVVSPPLTEGPFFVDEKLERSESPGRCRPVLGLGRDAPRVGDHDLPVGRRQVLAHVGNHGRPLACGRGRRLFG